MMWMMALCALPIVILFFAGGKSSSSEYFWPIFIGIFIVAHFWMMFRGHGSHSENPANRNGNDKVKDITAGTAEHKNKG